MSRSAIIDSFKSWLKEAGCGLHDDLDIVYSLESGYKWLAKDDIAQDADIVSVKKDICITQDSCREAFKSLKLSDLRDDLLVATYISLHYVYDELSNEPRSTLKHRPYVDILPEIGQTLTTLYWTEPELEYTKPTSLYKATIDRKVHWKADYEAVKQWLIANSLAIFNWDIFKHALTMITSRAFPSKLIGDDANTPMLVPLWDIGNHRPRSAVLWIDTAYAKTDSIAMKVPGGAKRGSEVFNNYGAKPTNELLLAYGFAVENLDYDVVPFKVGAGMSLSASKKSMLGKWGLLDADESLKTFNLSMGQSVPRGLKFLMRILADDGLSDEGVASLEELDSTPSSNQDVEFDVHVSLFQMLESKVESTSRSLSALSDGSGVRAPVQDMVATLLINQIGILTQAVDAIEEVLDMLDDDDWHKTLFKGLNATVYETSVGGVVKVLKVFHNQGGKQYANASFEKEAAAYDRLGSDLVDGVVWLAKGVLRIPDRHYGDVDRIPAILMPSFTATHKRLCDVTQPVSAEARDNGIEVLDAIHARGIYHGDINARNILVNTSTNDVKVVDYGSSKVLQAGEAEKEVRFLLRRFDRMLERT